MIAFTLPGGIPVYAFSLLAGVGVCTGLVWVARRVSWKQAMQRADAGLWVLLGALIGGRAVYVILSWTYFREHVLEAFLVNLGGLTWAGALAGGLVALVLVAVFTKQPLAVLANDLCPLVVAVAVCLWLGSWLDGCAYGANTTAWWGVPARDEWGVVTKRFPLQLLTALATLGWFWLLDGWAGKRNFPPGMLASLTFLGLSLGLLGVSLLRADPAPAWRGLRIDAWAALVFIALAFAVSLAIYLLGRVKAQKTASM